MIAAALALASSAPAPIAGRWITPDGASLIEIGRCGVAHCGRIIRFLKPQPGRPTTDVNNPQPALRTRPLVGLAILTDFVAAGDRWRGRAYDPRGGRSYRAELRRDGDALHVKGCIMIFCQTQDWRQAGG